MDHVEALIESEDESSEIDEIDLEDSDEGENRDDEEKKTLH